MAVILHRAKTATRFVSSSKRPHTDVVAQLIAERRHERRTCSHRLLEYRNLARFLLLQTNSRQNSLVKHNHAPHSFKIRKQKTHSCLYSLRPKTLPTKQTADHNERHVLGNHTLVQRHRLRTNICTTFSDFRILNSRQIIPLTWGRDFLHRSVTSLHLMLDGDE